MLDNANTEQEVSLYFKHIDSIVSTMGYRRIKTSFEDIERGYIKAFYECSEGIRYQSIYILNDYRGNGLYESAVAQHIEPILTMDKCNITPFLKSKGITFKELKSPIWYKMTADYYGDKTTERSGVRLMNHIDEGLIIMDMIQELLYSRVAGGDSKSLDSVFRKAKIQYAIHPIYQNALSGDVESDELTFLYDDQYRTLGNEYGNTANAYLSTRVIDSIDDIDIGNSHTSLALLVDKIQNYKDFLKYHQFTHKGSARLQLYFNNWFKKLIKQCVIFESDLYVIFNEVMKW